tara:strand:+ start:124 stop:486 length:363 start_codon:yes stop_codon:yes gene_type:complete
MNKTPFDPQSLLEDIEQQLNTELLDPANVVAFLEECRKEYFNYRATTFEPFLSKKEATFKHLEMYMFVFIHSFAHELINQHADQDSLSSKAAHTAGMVSISSVMRKVLEQLAHDTKESEK